MRPSRLARCAALLVALAAVPGCRGERALDRPPADPSCAAAVAPRPAGLIIAGTGASLVLVEEIARRYGAAHPGIAVHVPDSIGSGGAIRALRDGAIDVGFTSRALTAAERKEGFVETPIARSPLAFVAHGGGAGSITTAELQALYAGDRHAWPDGTPAVTLLREPGDSGNELIAARLPGLWSTIAASLAADRFTVCYSDQQMEDALRDTEGAIGFLDTGVLTLERLSLRALALDGVAPTAENAASGRYPLVRPLALVTRGAPSGEARRFIEFARSAAVADLLAAGGWLGPASAEGGR